MKKLAFKVMALVPLVFGSCGGSSDPEPGALTIAMTDAASQALSSFRIEVSGIQLKKATGLMVGVLEAPVAVDLVSLTELSQVLSLVHIPPGLYTQVRVSLDFTKARANIEGNSGPATILDWEGNALPPVLTLPIVLGNGLNMAAGRHRLLELDFDLDQSVRVDKPDNTVRVQPALVFRIDHTDPKDLLVVGFLARVRGNVIELELRDQTGARIQTVNVVVDPTTVYQVDGVPMTGDPGLAAVDAMPVGTSVQAYGTVNPAGLSIAGSYFEAGTGTYNGGQDIVEGHVIGLVGSGSPTLTVLGNTDNASHTFFESDVTVTIRTDQFQTKVVPHGSAQPFSLDDLNIGQRVRAYGSLNGSALEADLPNSVLRVQPSHAFGLALGPPSDGDLTIDLQQVDLLDETAFPWSEGGATPLDPNAMTVAVGSLATGLGIGAGTPVDLRGYFSPLSQSGHDFIPISVANLSSAPTLFLMQNWFGGATVSATAGPAQIQIELLGTLNQNEFAVLDRGYLGSTPLPPSPPFTANGSTGYFLIGDRKTGVIAFYTEFAGFSGILDKALMEGAELYSFGARGMFDEATNTMQVTLATAVVD